VSRVTAHGLSIDPPAGWDVRIYQRAGDDSQTSREMVEAGGTANPVLHLATVPLAADRGDYGSGVVEILRELDAFVALIEFDPEAATTPLFSRTPVPREILGKDLLPDSLQRLIAGQAGGQFFAHEAGRAFCLYAVAGAHGRRLAVAQRMTAALASLRIER